MPGGGGTAGGGMAVLEGGGERLFWFLLRFGLRSWVGEERRFWMGDKRRRDGIGGLGVVSEKPRCDLFFLLSSSVFLVVSHTF